MSSQLGETGRLSRQEVDRAIGFMDADGRRRVLSVVDTVYNAKSHHGTMVMLMQKMGDREIALGERVLLFFLNARYRQWRLGSSEQKASAIREISWLRAKLMAYVAVDHASALQVLSGASAGEGGKEKVDTSADTHTEAIEIAYRLCFGRTPSAEAMREGLNRSVDHAGFATWIAELHDTPESLRFRKASWTILNPPPGELLALINVDAIARGIVLVYQLTVGRTPALSEIDIWKGNFAGGLSFGDFLRAMYGSEEAKRSRQGGLANISDGRLIQLIYESILGYGIGARELAVWLRELASGRVEREDILKSIFKKFAVSAVDDADMQATEVHNALHCSIACTGKFLTVDRWNERAAELASQAQEGAKETDVPHARFYIQTKPGILVTAIASLYRGGKFIEQFMDNITSQSCFRDYAELVIVDADSPENEGAVISRYLKDFPQIIYKRMNYRIGIYDAWNVGAQIARGAYLTNTNLDDIRRQDSLELQAATLDNLHFVDVTYQDFYYTFDPRLSFEEIARFGFKSNLPVVTTMNMMDFNSPHNAPMWRKSLHKEVGYFDTSFKSAGDYDFWMRCLLAGKKFYKLNDAHVVYYQNPEGISTRPDTKGVQEGRRVFKTYARKLVPDNAVLPITEFLAQSKFMPQPEESDDHSRYSLAQRALRNVAMCTKYAGINCGGGR